MSRHPWLWFALIGLAPPLLLSGRLPGSSVALTAVFPALAAMLLLSSGEEPQPLPEHQTRRLLVAAGVAVVLVGTRLAWTGFDGLAYKLLVAAVPAVVAAWVLSGVYAPSPAVRRWVRSLVATGAPRRTLLVAVLVWPLSAAATIAVCAALPGLAVGLPRSASVGLLAVVAVTAVFAAALIALAWYGYAARLLLGRLDPFATGLLIGAVQWLVVWGVLVRPSTVLEPFFLFRLAGFLAASVAGVWVYRRSNNSLLPVWLLGIALAVSQALISVTVTPGEAARTDIPVGIFTAAQAAVALALVVTGRMWRSPADAEGQAADGA